MFFFIKALRGLRAEDPARVYYDMRLKVLWDATWSCPKRPTTRSTIKRCARNCVANIQGVFCLMNLPGPPRTKPRPHQLYPLRLRRPPPHTETEKERGRQGPQ